MQDLKPTIDGLQQGERKKLLGILENLFVAGYALAARTALQRGVERHPDYQQMEETRNFFSQYGIDIDDSIRRIGENITIKRRIHPR